VFREETGRQKTLNRMVMTYIVNVKSDSGDEFKAKNCDENE